MAEPGQDFGGFVSSSPESLFLSLLSYKIAVTVQLFSFSPLLSLSLSQFLLLPAANPFWGSYPQILQVMVMEMQTCCLWRVVKPKHPASASHCFVATIFLQNIPRKEGGWMLTRPAGRRWDRSQSRRRWSPWPSALHSSPCPPGRERRKMRDFRGMQDSQIWGTGR